MPISNYLELKDRIQQWGKRNDAQDLLDDFIDLAEADLWQVLRIREMEAKATATTSGKFLALPDGYLQMREMRLIRGDYTYNLRQVTPNSLRVLPAGMPAYYTITSQIEFDRPPAGDYTIEMDYYRSLTGLSASNATNAILSRFPNIYLYGAMKHFANWALNDAMEAKYLTLFNREVDQANKMDRKARMGAAPAMKSERPTP